MALTKVQKQKVIERLREKMARQKAVILVGIAGIGVKDITVLKSKLKAVNSGFQVAKKTLAEIVFKENKLDFDKKSFKEEIALVFGFGDEVSPAKTAWQFSRTNDKLKILGGFVENKFQDKDSVILLAQLPSRQELLAQLLGSISAPISGFENVLQGNIKGLIYALSAIKNR